MVGGLQRLRRAERETRSKSRERAGRLIAGARGTRESRPRRLPRSSSQRGGVLTIFAGDDAGATWEYSAVVSMGPASSEAEREHEDIGRFERGPHGGEVLPLGRLQIRDGSQIPIAGMFGRNGSKYRPSLCQSASTGLKLSVRTQEQLQQLACCIDVSVPRAVDAISVFARNCGSEHGMRGLGYVEIKSSILQTLWRCVARNSCQRSTIRSEALNLIVSVTIGSTLPNATSRIAELSEHMTAHSRMGGS